MKVYYAHNQGIYNTPQEQRDVAMMEQMGWEVVNPNAPGVDAAVQRIKGEDPEDTGKCMRLFEEMIDTCGALVFRGLPGGAIASGVLWEIRYAHECGLPVLELPTFALRAMLDKTETRQYLKEVGQR